MKFTSSSPGQQQGCQSLLKLTFSLWLWPGLPLAQLTMGRGATLRSGYCGRKVFISDLDSGQPTFVDGEVLAPGLSGLCTPDRF